MTTEPNEKEEPLISAKAALERLREGNGRWVTDARVASASTTAARRREMVAGQEPFAVVLGCADSRVPPEFIFDQGAGDLFVVRVAGNVAGPAEIGSIEFAVQKLGARLIVVLGHSLCGAVVATLDAPGEAAEGGSPYLASIMDRIRPAVAEVLATVPPGDRDTLVERAVRANTRMAADCLRLESQVLARQIKGDGLLVVGAGYDLETGIVDFFDGLPE